MADNTERRKENESDTNLEKRIETAIKFLQNPRVQDTSLSQRKAFLAKKGLTKDEIDKAIELSQTKDTDKTIVPASRNPVQGYSLFPGQSPLPSLRWRDFFWVAIVGGGFGYLLAHLVKTYFLPYVLSQEDDKDKKIDQLQTSVSELKENLSQTVGDIQGTLDNVQKILQDQQQQVQTLSLNFSTSQAGFSQSMTESYSLTEIKSELSSLKGLLLNRRQFPSPVVKSSPRIPAWQRNDTTNDSQLNENTDVKDAELITKNNENSTEYLGDHADSSSGTLEIPSSPEVSSFVNSKGSPLGSEKVQTDLDDSSFSKMSSDVDSPNLSQNQLKESLSETYVKLPK